MRLNFLRWIGQLPYTGPGRPRAKRKPRGWHAKLRRLGKISRESRKRNRVSYGKAKAKHRRAE